MMKIYALIVSTLLPLWLCAGEIVVYPTPKEMLYSRHNDDYTVRVRQCGGEWKDLFEYLVMVDLDSPQRASMVQFDFSGSIEVSIKKNNGMVHKVDVRPLSKGVSATIQGNTATFKLSKPQNLSVEFNGDRLHNLHLFANALETEVYKNGDPNVIYFGPGLHKPSDQPGIQFNVPSNTTVYLAPGAVLRGKLVVSRARNVRIVGRGVIDQAQRGIEILHSTNVTIDGVTVINPDHYTVFGGQSDSLTVRNLKSFSCKGWSDGIDLMSCRNVLVDNVFMRNSDDCIAVYGHRWDYFGNVDNVVVQNSTLWADVAHTITIGLHGDATGNGETIENITFKNIDILEHDEDDRDYQGAMSINASDKNLVRNVTFDDIRVEQIQEGKLLHVAVVFNEKYSAAPGRGVENVRFANITYYGSGENQSEILGYNEQSIVRNISFENIVVNGRKVKNLAEMGVTVNQFVKELKIK